MYLIFHKSPCNTMNQFPFKCFAIHMIHPLLKLIPYSRNVWRIAELKVSKIKLGEWIDFGHKDTIYKLKFSWLKFGEPQTTCQIRQTFLLPNIPAIRYALFFVGIAYNCHFEIMTSNRTLAIPSSTENVSGTLCKANPITHGRNT